MGVQQVPDPGQHGRPLIGWHGDDVAAGRRQVDDGFRGEVAAPLHVEPLQRPERRPDRRGGTGHVLLVTVDDPAQPGHPVLPLVADIPEQAKLAAAGQDPRHLGDGPVRVDPVPGLRDEHRIHTAVAQRDVLRRPRKNPNIRNGPGQLLPHAARRLDRDHVEAPVAQLPGELPGARPEIKNPARARREQPVDRLRRVGRAAPLVDIGGGAE